MDELIARLSPCLLMAIGMGMLIVIVVVLVAAMLRRIERDVEQSRRELARIEKKIEALNKENNNAQRLG